MLLKVEGRPIVSALIDGARNTLPVAMACAAAGIIIGITILTGFGITFTQWVVAIAQDVLLVALILTAIAGIVLGMGLPTTPSYILMAALLIPALVKMGVVTPGGAHVRLLLRDHLCNHAADRARGVRSRRSRQG